MGKIYKFLNLTVGCVNSKTDHGIRAKEYECDVVYATNNEIGFDYLRDNLKGDYESLCFKKEAFAIVDEVDSILIDEARTPLVISSESSSSIDLFPKINKIITLFKERDYELNEENKNVLLTNDGMEFAEKLLIENNLIQSGTLQDLDNMALNHNIIQGLRAHKLFIKDKDYILKDKQVVIIDDLSGRPMEGRRYGDGLHQAIEAKEGLTIQKENQTIASVTYQNFFRSYSKLSGMTGTAQTEANEFEGIYNLAVVSIPPNLKINRDDQNDQIYMTKKEKYDAVINLVKERHDKLQPILIGTTSVENSELISKMLKGENINHSILNAKHHEKEAEIIEKSGLPGNVTISTNMAGRGTDIKLGNDNEALKKQSINAGGLLVIGTERHESRRIDNQLRGRSGRQGDPGSSMFYISLQDDLMRIFGSESIDTIMKKFGLKEGESIDHRFINKAIERAQQRVEARNYDIRKHLLNYDDVTNDQRKVIFEQRKEILKSDNITEIINSFLEDVIKNFSDEKEIFERENQIDSFKAKIRPIMGRSFKEEEITDIIKLKNNEK